MLIRSIFLSLLITIVGCRVSPFQENPKVVITDTMELPRVICWSNGLVSSSKDYWLLEAKKRFTNPVVFLCHGNYKFVKQKIAGQEVQTFEWWAYPDSPRQSMSVQSIADYLSNLYPDNDIVLIICNPASFRIKGNRVFFSKTSIWTIPDDFQNRSIFNPFWHEVSRDFNTTGSIWEFYGGD